MLLIPLRLVLSSPQCFIVCRRLPPPQTSDLGCKVALSFMAIRSIVGCLEWVAMEPSGTGTRGPSSARRLADTTTGAMELERMLWPKQCISCPIPCNPNAAQSHQHVAVDASLCLPIGQECPPSLAYPSDCDENAPTSSPPPQCPSERVPIGPWSPMSTHT